MTLLEISRVEAREEPVGAERPSAYSLRPGIRRKGELVRPRVEVSSSGRMFDPEEVFGRGTGEGTGGKGGTGGNGGRGGKGGWDIAGSRKVTKQQTRRVCM